MESCRDDPNFELVAAAAKTALLAAFAVAATAAYLAGVNELIILAAGGLLAAGWQARRSLRADRLSLWLPITAVASGASDVGLARLFLVFVKIGSVLYGSGYVLLAFLQSELVDRRGWITSDQLLDAVSIGQVTPGPVFSTATFVGYLTSGFPGAVVATIGIFAPAFLFVALLTRLVAWMRASHALGAALDGVNAAAVGLMAGVSAELAGDAVIDPLTAAILVATGAALWRTRVNSAWLIAGGAAVGIIHTTVA